MAWAAREVYDVEFGSVPPPPPDEDEEEEEEEDRFKSLLL